MNNKEPQGRISRRRFLGGTFAALATMACGEFSEVRRPDAYTTIPQDVRDQVDAVIPQDVHTEPEDTHQPDTQDHDTTDTNDTADTTIPADTNDTADTTIPTDATDTADTTIPTDATDTADTIDPSDIQIEEVVEENGQTCIKITLTPNSPTTEKIGIHQISCETETINGQTSLSFSYGEQKIKTICLNSTDSLLITKIGGDGTIIENQIWNKSQNPIIRLDFPGSPTNDQLTQVACQSHPWGAGGNIEAGKTSTVPNEVGTFVIRPLTLNN